MGSFLKRFDGAGALLFAVLFVCLTLPLGLFLAIDTPPGQVADEAPHMARASALSRGIVLAHRELQTSGPMPPHLVSGIDDDPALFVLGFQLATHEKDDEEREAAGHRIAWSSQPVFIAIGPIANYLPVFYAPAAAAIAVARLLHGTPYDAMRLGRLVNLAVYLAMGAAAIALTRRGHALLFCVLAVPESVSLAASFNQDGLIVASAALAAALLTRSLEPDLAADAVARCPRYWFAALLIGLIAVAKLPYLPMAAMLLVPLPRSGAWHVQRPAMRLRLAAVAAVAVPALAWTAYAMARIATPVLMARYTPGPLWPGDPAQTFDATAPAAQLRVLAAHPTALVTLVVDTIAHEEWLIRQAIGNLGYFDVVLPRALYLGWEIAVVAALFAALFHARRTASPVVARQSGGGLRWTDFTLLVLASVATVWAIYLSQYITWTHVGLDRIEGPSGRYFLPMLPMLALVVPRWIGVGARVAPAAFAVLPLLAALASLAIVPHLVLTTWYLR